MDVNHFGIGFTIALILIVLAFTFLTNTLMSTCLFTGILAFLSKHVEIVNEKTNDVVLVIMHKYRLLRS